MVVNRSLFNKRPEYFNQMQFGACLPACFFHTAPGPLSTINPVEKSSSASFGLIALDLPVTFVL